MIEASGQWTLGVLIGLPIWGVLSLALLGFTVYRPVQGTVSSIGDRFVGGGDTSTNQLYVVTLDGSGQQYAVDDTRAALLHKGDRVTLRCIREWDYGSNNAGSYCKWGQ